MDFWNNEFLVLNDQDKFNVFRSKRIPNNQSPVIILHHGGGHSALSWSLVAKKLISSQIEVIAYDARGHGSTINADEDDLSLERLSKDLFTIMSRLYSDETRSRDFILVGHSMGGPVVVDCVINHLKGFNILGVVLIDVVEGTAVQSLPYMRQFLRNRPSSFKSIKEAVDWSLATKTLKHPESAQLSIPSQLKKQGDLYVWRTDLSKSEKFWHGWFENLSTKFLSCKTAKLLIVAGTDRLQDKNLMIGQMQGKFQMVILPESGHSVHEDAHEKVSEYLVGFWKRNHRLILPPKVSLSSASASSKETSPIDSWQVKIPDA